MKIVLCSLLGGMLVLTTLPCQAADDCCTPEATAKIAASAGFLDILGIKLGMTPEQALAAVKAITPALKIDLAKLQSNWDYLAGINNDSSVDPKKRWVTGIQGTSPGGPAVPSGYEEIRVGLTSPPNPQVVYGLSR